MNITGDLLSGVALLSVDIRELRFLDEPDQMTRGPFGEGEANIEIQIGVSDDGREGRITLQLTVTTPGQSQPFREMAVSVEGQFRQMTDAPAVPMQEFLNRQGPVILMPFVRDALATATLKTRFGPVLLPPLNVAAMLDRMAKNTPVQPSAAQ
jgi:preprotein translocase subunit SecB